MKKEKKGKLVGVVETGRACSVAQASAEELGQTGSAAKERVTSVPQCEQLAGMPEPHLLKRK